MTKITVPLTFTLDIEPNGCCCWVCPHYEYQIYATPYHENSRGISWQATTVDGDTPYSGNVGYIGDEVFWADWNTKNQNSEPLQSYVDYMSVTGLKQILRAIAERKAV